MQRVASCSLLATALALISTGTSCAAPADTGAFVLEELASHVWLARPSGGEPTHANSLVVERDDGLLVVDAQPTRAAARSLLAALDQRFDAAVRYLVLSQPHADSTGGAAEFADDVIVIGSGGCREAMIDPQFVSDAPIGSVAPDELRPPTWTLDARSVLHGRGAKIELLPVGHARTRGDLLVRLPQENVVFLGGMSFHAGRNSYGRDAKIGRWLSILNDVMSGPDAVVVGARGPVMRSIELRPVRDGLVWLRSETARAWVDNVPVEKTVDHVLSQPGIGDYFDVDAEPSNLRGLVERVLEESLDGRRKRGQL